jgi:hypothetical protein
MPNPSMGEGVVATAEAGGRHVSVRVEYAPTGWVIHAFETDGNTEIAHEISSSLGEGKQRAEEIAKSYLADRNLKLPTIRWKRIR